MMRPDGNAPVYVISVAAKLTGLPAWMLRLLDQEGLVVPSRTEKNRRLYSDNDIARLERIRYLFEERHVNMAGVRYILEMQDGAGGRAHRTGPGATNADMSHAGGAYVTRPHHDMQDEPEGDLR